MEIQKYVQVSLDAPDEWYDPKGQMWFKKSEKVIEIKKGTDMTNITRYIRFNYLLDITEKVLNEGKVVEPAVEFVTKTPKQLLVETEKVEAKVEEAVAEEVKVEATEVAEDTKVEVVADEKQEHSDKEECPYCGKEYSTKGIAAHKKSCKKNPDNQ